MATKPFKLIVLAGIAASLLRLLSQRNNIQAFGNWKSPVVEQNPLVFLKESGGQTIPSSLWFSRQESCVSQQCINRMGISIGQVWTRRFHENWCFGSQDGSNATEGLILIKVPKSASSTMAGIVLRIADRKACGVRWQHRRLDQYTELSASHGSAKRHFLVAPIREAGQRALSAFYFHHVSFHGRRGKSANERYLVHQLHRLQPNYILNYTAPRGFTTSRAQNDTAALLMVQEVIKEILETYDFLVVVDRMVDSLVVLSWLTGLSLDQFLTMSSKQSGSYYNSGHKCIPLVKPAQTDSTRKLLESTEWRLRHYGDYLLHAVAEASLNATIKEMGRPLFDARVDEFRKLQTLIDTECSAESHFPCSFNGTLQLEKAEESCYLRDFGCGYRCVDRVIYEYSGRSKFQ